MLQRLVDVGSWVLYTKSGLNNTIQIFDKEGLIGKQADKLSLLIKVKLSADQNLDKLIIRTQLGGNDQQEFDVSFIR